MKIPTTYEEFVTIVNGEFSGDIDSATTALSRAGMPDYGLLAQFGSRFYVEFEGYSSHDVGNYDCQICGKPYGH